MQRIKNPIILREDDYQILISLVKGAQHPKSADAQSITDLEAELKKAKLVTKENFPSDAVRLNSKIKIKELGKNRVWDIILVTPDKADIKKGKISVMAPVGIAIIGFPKGKTIRWGVPSGKKSFTIMNVIN